MTEQQRIEIRNMLTVMQEAEPREFVRKAIRATFKLGYKLGMSHVGTTAMDLADEIDTEIAD
ncbi:MAG: hypothetical protein ABIH03_02355 [Pseudomonadota bacterium]